MLGAFPIPGSRLPTTALPDGWIASASPFSCAPVTGDRRRFPANAFDPAVVEEVAQSLASSWDHDGAILRAAQALVDPRNPARPRNYGDYARAVIGFIAAGGSQAEISRFLRQEEETLLGAQRTTGHARWTVARAAWTATGRDRRDAPEESGG
jgi:hypothetical protein